MDFAVGASPGTQVVLTRYDAAVFPKFRTVFDEPRRNVGEVSQKVEKYRAISALRVRISER
jgi:hypothetical protein